MQYHFEFYPRSPVVFESRTRLQVRSDELVHIEGRCATVHLDKVVFDACTNLPSQTIFNQWWSHGIISVSCVRHHAAPLSILLVILGRQNIMSRKNCHWFKVYESDSRVNALGRLVPVDLGKVIASFLHI